ncbi:alpha/beta fold hydrolase [Ancylobacter terrae]|uniref:alpha/beta fold hydrolase n=1 Tax=Ancylobacter sp. sgz301288 TaxID=3342077 RepID=UPI003859A4AA
MSEMFWTERDGVSLHYKLSGEGHSLVLIHELSGTSDSWDEVVKRLEGGYRILRTDQRGTGLSEKVRQAFDVADMVDDIIAIIAASGLPPPYTVAGIASGAAIAVEVAARLGTAVEHLLLCSPALKANPDRRDYLVQRGAKARQQGMRSVVDVVFERSYPTDVITDRAVYDEYRSRFLAIDPVCYDLANHMLAGVDVTAAKLKLTCPVLVLAGNRDLLRPVAHVEEDIAGIADCSLRVVDSGHIMILQAPDAVASAIRTLHQASGSNE